MGSVRGLPLVVMALPAEGEGLFEAEDIAVLYTGLGKVNAAIALTRRLTEYAERSGPLPLVVNFGSAGSHRFPTGALVSCSDFVQRDMDVQPLGFEIGVTPYEDIPAVLRFNFSFPGLPQGVCGSGDSFAVDQQGMTCDVVDMEAYALAKVCWVFGAQFACAKYISDGADHAAGDDWTANHHRGAAAFLAAYKALVS
ncbi:MAG TPA: 5'-nucleosidase [Steroidobacteraceae bacterium]|nr:5'-nucleosidase [Steroidobacteraceae bacterium]